MKVKVDFEIRNDGPVELLISDVHPTCGCTVASFDASIAPGAVGKIHAEIDTVDFSGPIAKTITVNQQTRNGETTTPKGRTRRTIPMTETLLLALRRMEVIREGLVVRNLDGTAKTDGQADAAIQRICRRAGLPTRYWHTLRHSLGTHAALCGVLAARSAVPRAVLPRSRDCAEYAQSARRGESHDRCGQHRADAV